MMADDEEGRIMADTPRWRVRAILRAIGRAWMRTDEALRYPPPDAADVAHATRATWYVWRLPHGGYAWRAACGCISDQGTAPTQDAAEGIGQSIAMRLRRYATQ